MEAPDYLICLECETPCYVFEWLGEKLVEITCLTCGNDSPDSFATPEEIEEME
jgi:hypothetical protein